jgi:hypothetical protein
MPETSVYEQRLETLREKLTQLKQSSRQMSWIRLFVFVVLVIILFSVIVPLKSPMIFLGYVLGGIVVFMLPLRYHQRILDSIAFTEALIAINKNELNRIPDLFSDGTGFGEHSSLAADIDVLGAESLFHKLNRCITSYGNSCLTKTLINNPPNSTFILNRQKALQELTPEIDLRQNLIALALLGNEKKKYRYSGSSETFYTTPNWSKLVTLWPYFSAIAIGLGIYVHGIFYALPFLAWWPISQQGKRVQALYREISGTSGIWKSYAQLFDRFNKQDFKTEELKALSSVTHGAANAIHQLSKLSARWDQRQNGLAIGFMNTLVLFDIKCAYDYEQWKQKHQSQLNAWLDAIGQIEMLNSLSTFAFNHSNFIYPIIKSGKPEIQIDQLGHPLVAASSIVTNNIHLGPDASVYIITGSNMSGKSTFLRALGLNIILAQAGAPVFASAMTFTPINIHTSFRQSDSVQESTSYFMAELKRLKEIVEAVDQPGGSLVLLDEILRGTNSEDKSHGSEVLLQKLMTRNAITLLATHDLKLGTLETQYPGQVVNYCFESEIKNNELKFDYTIRRGIAKNKNATFLMKKMGIV